MYGSHACGGSGVEEVARLQREELTDVGYQLVHLMEHVGRMSALDSHAIDVEVEVEVLDITSQRLLGDEAPHDRRAVESLAEFPGMSLCTQAFLQVARREVDAHSDGVVVAMSEARRDATPQTTDAHDKLRLVVTPLREIRNKERAPAREQSRVRLREDDGLLCNI